MTGFASFPNPRRKNPVIYVSNDFSQDLNVLYNDLMFYLKSKSILSGKSSPLPYSPHMTIAYRDLSLDQYEKAWSEFKDRKYNSTVIIDTIFMLKFNTGENKWNIHKSFPFKMDESDVVTIV